MRDMPEHLPKSAILGRSREGEPRDVSQSGSQWGEGVRALKISRPDFNLSSGKPLNRPSGKSVASSNQLGVACGRSCS